MLEFLEVPHIRLIVGVQDIPVVSQRQVPTVLSFVFQVQFLEVVDARCCATTAQLPCVDKVVNIPVVTQRQTPRVPSVQKTTAIPLLQCVDKGVYVPVVQVVQVPQVPSRKR